MLNDHVTCNQGRNPYDILSYFTSPHVISISMAIKPFLDIVCWLELCLRWAHQN